MAKTNNRRGRNNNPQGHNQYSSDWMGTVRDAPMKSAAAAAAAVGAGVFLWSKRNEISGQLSRLSDQITDWAEDMRSNMSSNSDTDMALTDNATGSSRSTASGNGRSTSSRSRGSTARSTTTGPTMSAGRSDVDTLAH